MEETVEIKLCRECSLCANIFTDPRMLPCLHTFCLKCLEKTGVLNLDERTLCPVCGSDFIVPGEGLSGLPKNVFAEKSTDIRNSAKYKLVENPLCDVCTKRGFGEKEVVQKYCINCEEKLCLTCCTEHGKEKEHLIVDLNYQEDSKKEDTEACRCHVHEEEKPELYCTFCKKVICDKCRHESHSSHYCSKITDVVNLDGKQAEKEYSSIQDMQLEFEEKRQILHREQMKFLEKVKKMETEIVKRCEEIKDLVVNETKALLQELAVLKKERLEEIEIEQRNIDKHVFTLEKFKEYCARIKSIGALNYSCEAECILQSTTDHLKSHQQSRIQNRIFPFEFEFQKTQLSAAVMPISNIIGKIKVICPYKMEQPVAIDTNGKAVHGMASLKDKLYLLSNSILIFRAQNPYDWVGEINTQDIDSPTRIMSCLKTSCLYVYDKGTASIWKVSIPSHQVARWFDKVKEPCAMSVSSNGEVLMVTQSAGQPVTFEIYNENAIRTGRTELPKAIQSLHGIYETHPGNYIGFGALRIYKFRADGSIVNQSEITKYPKSGGCARCLELSSYNVFLVSSSQETLEDSKVLLIGLDLSWHRTLLTKRNLVSLCYVKETKRLAVLEKVQTSAAIVTAVQQKVQTSAAIVTAVQQKVQPSAGFSFGTPFHTSVQASTALAGLGSHTQERIKVSVYNVL